MGRRGMALVLYITLGLLFMSSCAVIKKSPPLPKPVKPVRPVRIVRPVIPATVPEYDPSPAINEAKDQMTHGEYEKAASLYKSALSLHPGNKKLLSGYREALLNASADADISFGRGDFGKAGGLYFLVARNYKYTRPAALKSWYLKKRIRDCSEALTQKGLANYRQGKIEEAIVSWDEVLKFDPGNAEIKKAAETARLQLKNLSK